MRLAVLLAAAVAAVSVPSLQVGQAAAQEAPQATAIVQTTGGRIQGLLDRGISTFKGIRYGKAPVGDLRFMPPEAPEPWDGIYAATAFGAPAMQMYSPSGPNHTAFTTEIQTIFPTLEEGKIDNEDSLFLNVWTPATDGAARPVMVWFHGGGYNYGSGAWPAYDGRNLAAKGDVVVVTVNHRLNAFGYLYLAEQFGDEFAESGNAGNLDLIASLEWVRDNIAGFGGDPNNVTIMGESGGGSKVSHLLATPSADGLFHKAIIQSGPGVTAETPETAAELTNQVLSEAGVTTVAELRAVPAEDLLAAAQAVMARNGGGFSSGMRFSPVADGVVLPRNPFVPAAPAQSADVPVMIGWNKDEMTIFTAPQPWFGRLTDDALDQMSAMFGEEGPQLIELYRRLEPDYSPTHVASRAMGARFAYGSYVLADAKAAQNSAPVYAYWLTWETPVNDGLLRTPHTLDIPLMFDNVDKARVLVGSGEAPERMAEMMSDAWISFARTGQPTSDLLPEWQPYTRENRRFMKLDLTPRMVTDPEREMREILSAAD